jgi:hypothetical protein
MGVALAVSDVGQASQVSMSRPRGVSSPTSEWASRRGLSAFELFRIGVLQTTSSISGLTFVADMTALTVSQKLDLGSVSGLWSTNARLGSPSAARIKNSAGQIYWLEWRKLERGNVELLDKGLCLRKVKGRIIGSLLVKAAVVGKVVGTCCLLIS